MFFTFEDRDADAAAQCGHGLRDLPSTDDRVITLHRADRVTCNTTRQNYNNNNKKDPKKSKTPCSQMYIFEVCLVPQELSYKLTVKLNDRLTRRTLMIILLQEW